MLSSLDDTSRIRTRKIKIGILVFFAISIVWITVAISVIYSNAFALISVLCVIFGPIPVAMCYEDHEEAFFEDRSMAKDIIKGVGYIMLLSTITMAFCGPLILMYEGMIGPDMFAWISVIAFIGGCLNILIVHGILTGF